MKPVWTVAYESAARTDCASESTAGLEMDCAYESLQSRGSQSLGRHFRDRSETCPQRKRKELRRRTSCITKLHRQRHARTSRLSSATGISTASFWMLVISKASRHTSTRNAGGSTGW